MNLFDYKLEENYDIRQVPDEVLFDPEKLRWPFDNIDGFHAEVKRRKEAKLDDKRQEQERIEQERIARVMALKAAIPYSEALAQEICERISVGELLINICNDEHMPTMRSVNQWLKTHQDFAAVYKESINDRLRVFEEEVLKIADDMKQDFKTITKRGKEMRVADPDVIARAKLRIDVRFRHLKAGMPQKWGDSQTIITKDANDDDMSFEELERCIADIEAKSRIVKEPMVA
jgi:hypothetical protein